MLRLININSDTGEVELTSDYINVPPTQEEYAIQRALFAIIMTAGTIVDAPTWGGSLLTLLFTNRPSKDNLTRQRAAAVLSDAMSSLESSERLGPWRITNMSLIDVVRKTRGFNMKIRIDYQDATSTVVEIPDVLV